MSRLSVLALLVVVLVACLSLATPAAARIDLSSFFKSVSLVSSEGDAAVARVAEAPVSSPNWGVTVFGVFGCYYTTTRQTYIQCGLGQSITLLGDGITADATVSLDNGRFACTGAAVNSSVRGSVTCTLPTSVPADRLGVVLTVNVTAGGSTSQNFYGGVTLLAQPIRPTITSIAGCLGGTSGSAVTACRYYNQLTLQGIGIYPARPGVSVRVGNYSCNNVFATSVNAVTCTVPDVDPSDINQPLAVSLTLDGYSTSYASTLTTWGRLLLSTVTGCGTTSGTPQNCTAGNTIVLTGSGFNLGPQGDANDLSVTVGGQPCTSFTVLSNTQISCVLPPVKLYSAGVLVSTSTRPAVSTFYVLVYYAQQLVVGSTYGKVRGCRLGQAPYPRIPLCSAGDVLCITLNDYNLTGTSPPVNSIILSGANNWQYPCTPVTYNRSVIQCTVPSIRSSDLNSVLGVQVSAPGLTSDIFPNGTFVPLPSSPSSVS